MNTNRFPPLLTALAAAVMLLAVAGCQAVEPTHSTSKFLIPFVGQLPTGQGTVAYPPPEPSQTLTPLPPTITFTPFQPGITLTPSLTVKPTDPPIPTNVYPTLAMKATSTPYVRPAGAKGQTLPASKWQQWPIIPVVSDRAKALYKAALAAGRDPKRFSKVGDCQVIRQYFLGMFDDHANSFRLGDKYTYLQRTLDQFAGSWTRVSESVRTGFNVASVTTPLYANVNPNHCKVGETPLQCEFRIWNPSIVIISMETWTDGRPTAAYEGYMRAIVDFVIANHALPIIATKADNKEGDNSINASIARIAADYDIPLWNFWAAAQPLPDHGLMDDGFHLTNGPEYFDSPSSMKLGWPTRNLTALQTIDTVYQAVRK